jgi:hypothetical protein
MAVVCWGSIVFIAFCQLMSRKNMSLSRDILLFAGEEGTGEYSCTYVNEKAEDGEVSPAFCRFFHIFDRFCGCPHLSDEDTAPCLLCPGIGIQNPYVISSNVVSAFYHSTSRYCLYQHILVVFCFVCYYTILFIFCFCSNAKAFATNWVNGTCSVINEILSISAVYSDNCNYLQAELFDTCCEVAPTDVSYLATSLATLSAQQLLTGTYTWHAFWALLAGLVLLW